MYDTALILSVGKFREYDAWVRLLTRTSGICTAFAFGASKSRRRFAGCLDTLNIVSATIEKSPKKNFLQLKETSLISTFSVRTDWRYTGIATNCLRFIEALNIDPETSLESFDFITDFFELLKDYPANPSSLPPLFRFKLASIQGYAPHIQSCVQCDSHFEKENMAVFSVQDGGALCKDCAYKAQSRSMHINISSQTLQFLEKVQSLPATNWLQTTIPAHTTSSYSKIIDAFVQYHLGLEWKKNRFVSQ